MISFAQWTSALFAALVLQAPFAAGSLHAQDRQGNDTAGDWRPTHFERFDGWDSICDERGEDADLQMRCYVRYVDVFSPRPKFGAVFSFITPEGRDGYKIEFGIEQGVRYRADGFQIERGEEVVWTLPADCRRARPCLLEKKAATEFIDTVRAGGGNLIHRFTGRYGKAHDLAWPLAPLMLALDDFERAAAQRGLR
ncbi:MAG: hypothetical protein AAF441_17530 [Pseudomonadota bacterium]